METQATALLLAKQNAEKTTEFEMIENYKIKLSWG
jgi:hypothetical protein